MREIKFRAWDRENKKMSKDVLIDGYGNVFCDDVNDCNEQWNRKVDWAVLEYTGLKDKNGKETYEGDLCKFDWHKGLLEVVFAEGSFGFFIPESEENTEYYYPLISDKFEVIGNVWENPELLK